MGKKVVDHRNLSTHILTRRMTVIVHIKKQYNNNLSTHILTRRMTAILNKIYVIQNRTIYNFYTKMFLSFTFQPNISV